MDEQMPQPEDSRRIIIRLACNGLDATLDSEKNECFKQIVEVVLNAYQPRTIYQGPIDGVP